MSKDSVVSKKIRSLINRLHSKTLSGDVEWKPTSIPDRYVLQLPQTGIAIRKIEQQPKITDLLNKDPMDLEGLEDLSEKEEGYELTILNSENKEIESFNIFKSSNKVLYGDMKEIFQNASTGFSNTSQAISAVIDDLESIGKDDSFEPEGDLPF